MQTRAFVNLAVAAAAVCASLRAEVVRVEAARRTDVLNGSAFGAAGPYERVVGKVWFAVDPAAPANSRIVDIGAAPRNEKGLVEFSADFYVLQPRDAARGNGGLIVEVLNRGGKAMLGRFQRAAGSNDPSTAAHFGDGMLMEQGYTLAWIGWQHDVPQGGGRMRVYVPELAGITGPVRSEFTASRAGITRFSLGDSGHQAYPVADPASVRITVRDGIEGRRTPVKGWRVDGTDIVMDAPLALGRAYEVVYTGSRPQVAGLGLAAMRDFVSFLKHGGGGGGDNELSGRGRVVKRAIGFGSSQSGALLRAFVYEGFNADEKGRLVFDGVFAHIAGGRRLTFHRFTQLSRTAGPLRNATRSTTDQFPFTDAAVQDAVTSRREGLLDRAAMARAVPKMFHTNSAYEYWGSGGALIHSSPDGQHDIPLPDTSRAYMFSGGQHGPAAFPPKPGGGRYAPSFNEYTWALRALLARLDAWIKDGVEPPPSRIPLVADGTLVERAGYRFPRFAAAPELPRAPHTPMRLDFGDAYRTRGVIEKEPPRVGRPFVARVPQADADGNDVAGVRMPAVATPLGTFTGWNLRGEAVGATGELMANTGSYFPLPWTKAERERTGDPRLSVEERYADRRAYLDKVAVAARQLVKDGFLLERDVDAQVEAAAAHWDWRAPAATSSLAAGR